MKSLVVLILINLSIISNVTLAGTPEQDDLVKKLRSQFISALPDIAKTFLVNTSWSCSEASLETNKISHRLNVDYMFRFKLINIEGVLVVTNNGLLDDFQFNFDSDQTLIGYSNYGNSIISFRNEDNKYLLYEISQEQSLARDLQSEPIETRARDRNLKVLTYGKCTRMEFDR